MKIAILYICTGKYSIFWEPFFQSSEFFFLKGREKHYFVFTDTPDIKSTSRIHIRFESSKGFPMDSLLRFDMFLSVSEELKEFDYVFFFNSNMRFVDNIEDEILPINSKSGLVALIHPGYYNRSKFFFPYERNKKSKAFIPYNKDKSFRYYMGSLNGGRTKEFIVLSQVCSNNIHQDLENGIIAIYHDESHLNYYLNDKNVHGLEPSYGFPEDSNLSFKPKIIILNKIKHGGKYFDKLPKKSYILRIMLKLKRFYSSIIWKFK